MCGDEQYLKNNVCEHMETELEILPAIECWDQPHAIEKIWKYTIQDLAYYQPLKNHLDEIVLLLAGTWHETYIATAASMNIHPLQLSVLKSLKFVGHGLGQLRNFLKMVKVIIATAEKMTEKGHIDAGRVKRVLEKDSFLLELNLLIDFLQLMSRWSYATQYAHLRVNEFVNTQAIMKVAMTELKLEDLRSPSPTERFLFQRLLTQFESVLGDDEVIVLDDFRAPPEVPVGQRLTRAAEKVHQTVITQFVEASINADRPYEKILKDVKMITNKLLEQHGRYFWEGGKGKVWRQHKVPLLQSAAKLLNYAAGDCIELAPSILGINKGLWRCTKPRCRMYLDSLAEVAKCKAGVQDVPPLLTKEKLKGLIETDFDIEELSTLVNLGVKSQLTRSNFAILRAVFAEAANWLKVHKKITPTLDNVGSVIFHQREFNERLENGVLEIFQKCLVAAASEAVIETYGSVMEKNLSHYTRYTADDDR